MCVVLEEEDGNGLLHKLAEGFIKQYSIMKTGKKDAMEAADGNPWEDAHQQVQVSNEFEYQLGLHLRSAALAGEGDKAATTAHIMLRFSEAPARCGIIGCLVPLALHGITFDALHEALEQPVWTEEALSRLQVRLGQVDVRVQTQAAFRRDDTCDAPTDRRRSRASLAGSPFSFFASPQG